MCPLLHYCFLCCICCSEDVDYSAFARDLQSFFSELESLNSSLVVTADPSAGGSTVVRGQLCDEIRVMKQPRAVVEQGLGSFNSSLVVTADPSAGEAAAVG
jgi:hypothetical protein